MKTSIKINNQYIQKILLGSTPVQRIYLSGSIVYEAGGSTTPCFEVVSTISEASGDYVDVYVKHESKWYKRNNLNQYEEYGLMPIVSDLSSTTYYTGKLVILSTDSHEYKWNGSEWIDLGSAGTFIDCIWLDPSSNNSSYNIGYYWGTGYKMVCNVYLSGSYGGDTSGFLIYNNKSPLEFNFYSNGFYLDMHDPQSTSNNSCYSGDYSDRLMKTSSLKNYQSEQVINFTVTYGTVKAELEEGGTLIGKWGTERTGKSWYNGLYSPSISIGSAKPYHLSRIQVYDNNNNLVNDLKFVENEGETGSQKLSMYDSVLDVKYNNTNSNTPTYHITKKGEINPPVDYDEKVAPADNVHYNTLAELELMECPWIGMTATVGQDYTVYVYTENGWVIGDVPLDLPYMKFTALEDTTFTFTKTSYASQDLEVKYSIDGKPWKTMESGVATPTVPSGSYVVFKSNFKGGSGSPYGYNDNGRFSSTGNFNLSGNIMSLIYGDEFVGKTSLVDYTNVFSSLFINCTKLKSISDVLLPATTLSNQCYADMFNGCTGITSIPSGLLPATTLVYKCYYGMFSHSNVNSIPADLLPATNLADYCYSSMFAYSKVNSVPSGLLPATNLLEGCYSSMFAYTNVNSIPSNLLPATNLADYCYYRLFSNSKITSVPSGLLHATNLADNCYQEIFSECTNLKSADIELPATTVNKTWAYQRMFFNCANLTDSPIIKATSVSGNNPFGEMFYGCRKMKYLVCDMLNEPSSSISSNWLKGVAETGTFYKNPNATWDQTITNGNDTVPTGWNIVNSDVEPNYLTFTVVDPNGSTFKFNNSATEYSIDNGTWTSLDRNTDSPLVQENSSIRFRGTITPSGNESQKLTVVSSGKFNVSGNILTLLYGANCREGQISKADKSYVFYRMFYNNTNVIDAGNLILPVFGTAPNYGFKEMFRGCTNLTTSPVMKADTTGRYSFRDVFNGCTSLTTVNEIYCGNTNTESHVCMFEGCTSLISVPNINVTTTWGWSIQWMFRSCTSLQDVVLKGNIIEPFSSEMLFSGCTSLTSVTYLGSQKPAKNYTTNWMADVPENGTFYMNKNYSWDSTVSRDANGVPAGWTIVKVDPNDY